METTELIEILSRGEDSKTQFKINIHNQDSIASEIVAFSNSGGGKLIIGVDDNTWDVVGLTKEEVESVNQRASSAALQSVKPPVSIISENVSHPNGLVVVITVSDGLSKPYMDNRGQIWIKNMGNKDRVTSREVIQRMFQSSGLIHGDETPANGLTVADIDLNYFEEFFFKEYGEGIDSQENSIQKIFENMNLAKTTGLNIAGALLFGRQVHFRLPAYIVKTVSYPGTEIDEDSYLDSRDIIGKISDIFQQSLSFISGNIRHVQSGQNVNSTGEWIVPRIVFEELLANALIHRDYFTSAPVRVFVFLDRVEIISPGHLPNNLTIDNIKFGNTNVRNPILASFATKILPYRGLGNGIRRAIRAYSNIELIDDKPNNLFKAIIRF